MPTTTGKATEFITFSRASNATVVDADGRIKWAPHNLVLNSAAPATQTITVISGAQYTVNMTGSGSVALSGAGSGTVTTGNPVTVTASTTTLTLTVSGTVSTMWAYRSDLGGMQANAQGSLYNATTGSAYYGPRRDFDPVTLACRGLLVEEARTNLLLHSAAFDVTATWTNVISGTGTNSVRTADAGVSPNGTSTADRLQLTLNSGTTSSDAVRVRQSATPAATAHTFSVWLKSYDGVSTYTMGIQGVGSQTITVTGQWQRFVFSFTGTGSSTGFDIFIRGGQSPAHSDSVDVLAWGAQLEAGSFATSYIPTGAATATRSADIASVSTQAFPYSDTAGTYVVAFDTLSAAATMLGNQSGPSAAIAYSNASIVLTYNGSTAASVANTYTIGAATKAAVAYDGTGRAVCVNAGTVGTASGAMQAVTDVRLGGSAFTGTALNGHVRQVTYLPRRLTSSELQTRTAA